MNSKFTLIKLIFFLFFISHIACSQNGVELQNFASGFNSPVEISHAGDDRLFVVERAGIIRIVDLQGNINATPFMDITDRVKSGGEQGLLGLAFHPDYATNGYFYVNYTDGDDNTNIARFSVSGNPDQADPSSETTLLVVEQPFQNHNGGHVEFGPDGFLYIGLGDGGSGGDPGNRAQNLETYLGKMLRIDVDNGDPYAIPPDNPFINDPDSYDEIWAYGLRNPWKFTFDSETGDLWIADVGQNEIEEIDLQPSSSGGGENYGWRCYEGSAPFNTSGCGPQSEYVFPVFEYSHDLGCSVTGGYVYRGNNIPQLQGYYVFTDYCSDNIWTLHQDGNEWVDQLLGTFTGNNFSTFGVDVNGELYIAGISTGTIYKFIDTSSGVNIRSNSQMKVFPNPVRDVLNVESIAGLNIRSVTISDLQGQEVYHQDTSQSLANLDLRSLPPGSYLVFIKADEQQFYEKITKL